MRWAQGPNRVWTAVPNFGPNENTTIRTPCNCVVYCTKSLPVFITHSKFVNNLPLNASSLNFKKTCVTSLTTAFFFNYWHISSSHCKPAKTWGWTYTAFNSHSFLSNQLLIQKQQVARRLSAHCWQNFLEFFLSLVLNSCIDLSISNKLSMDSAWTSTDLVARACTPHKKMYTHQRSDFPAEEL